MLNRQQQRDKTNSPFLIVGCRRSGTTLLRTIFESHPDLLVHPNEPQFFLELYNRYSTSKMPAKSAIQHIVEHPYRAPEIQVDSFSSSAPRLDLIELAEQYMEAWTAGRSDKRPVLKDPRFVFHLDTLSKLFPNCTVINIIRDPRANVSSQRLRWPQFSVWTCAMYWKHAIQAAMRWGAQHPVRYVTISYEALVQDPEVTVRQLCETLCLPYTERLLNFRHKQTIFGPGGNQRVKEFTKPDPSHQDLWKQRLSAEDIQLIEICCAQEMAVLGYEPISSHEPSLTLQFRKLREQTAYRYYMFGKHTKSILRRINGHLQAFFVESNG